MFKSTDGAESWHSVNTGLASRRIYDISALAIDPALPTTLYATTVYTGIFKSSDGAESWDISSDPKDSLPPTGFCSLAINPLTPTTLYAGGYGDGMIQSVDGGTTWQRFGQGLPESVPVINLP